MGLLILVAGFVIGTVAFVYLIFCMVMEAELDRRIGK